MAESQGGCSNCGHLQAQVHQLQQELASARREIQHLRQRIQRLRQAIQRARATCQHYIRQTGEVLSQRSGVPFGKWVYCKGAYQVAANVLAVLNQGEG